LQYFELWDELCGDLLYCATWLIYTNELPPLPALIWESLLHGGCLCGWHGLEPEYNENGEHVFNPDKGKFIVYVDSDDTAPDPEDPDPDFVELVDMWRNEKAEAIRKLSELQAE
jgi:hypothetical protein